MNIEAYTRDGVLCLRLGGDESLDYLSVRAVRTEVLRRIVDADLPDTDGLQLVERIKQLAKPSVRIIVMFRSGIHADRIARYDAQLQSFITVTPELALQQADRADRERRAGQVRTTSSPTYW